MRGLNSRESIITQIEGLCAQRWPKFECTACFSCSPIFAFATHACSHAAVPIRFVTAFDLPRYQLSVRRWADNYQAGNIAVTNSVKYNAWLVARVHWRHTYDFICVLLVLWVTYIILVSFYSGETKWNQCSNLNLLSFLLIRLLMIINSSETVAVLIFHNSISW